MKLLVTWLKKDGSCRFWTNAEKVEQAAMSLVGLRGAVERMAADDNISFDAAWEKYFKAIREDQHFGGEKMDRRDAEKVIQNLRTKPFICSDNCLLLDNGYVILRKEYFQELKMSRELISIDSHITSVN